MITRKALYILLALLSTCYSQCPVTSTVNVSGKSLGGFIEVPATGCSSYEWTVNFSAFTDPDPIPLVIQFAPKSGNTVVNLGNLQVQGKATANNEWETYATLSQTTASPSVSVFFGATYDNDIAKDTTYGKVLRLRSKNIRFIYSPTPTNPTGYNLLFRISSQVENYDLDGDGFVYPSEDCCDTQVACSRPRYVNIGAYNIAGNQINDAGSGASCSSYSDVGEVTQCQSSQCFQGGTVCTAEDLTRALNLCKFVTEDSRQWGVISTRVTLTSGTGTPCPHQYSVLNSFTGEGNSVSYYNRGEAFTVLSSGVARSGKPSDGFYFDCNSGTSRVPQSYLNAYGGFLYDNSNGCGRKNTNDANTHDAVNLVVRMRVPTNANSFSFLIKFVSSEFPLYVCTIYNDFFIALLFRSSDPEGLSPIDGNVAYYTTTDGQRIPLSINLDVFFRVCLPGTAIYATPQRSVGLSCDPSLKNQLDGTAYQGAAGTVELTNIIPVYPGEVIELHFIIFDVVDSIYDSLVILDNFQWSTVQADGGLVIEDPCPFTDKTFVGQCGCDQPDIDSDLDGRMDCVDACPNDGKKTTTGACGCGVKDIYYSGSEQVCMTDSAICCTRDGYLGGTMNWNLQTSNNLARELVFTAEAFLSDNFWCFVDNPGIFVKCSQKDAYLSASRTARISDSVPALEINYGITTASLCDGSGVQLIPYGSAIYVGVWTNVGTYSSFSFTGATSNRATYNFAVATTGTYYLQIDVPARDAFLSTAPLTLEINGAGIQTILPYKPTGAAGWRTLGSFTFSASSTNSIVLRPSTILAPNINDFILATSFRITPHNPEADTYTASFSQVDLPIYVRPGSSISVQAVSTCNVDIYAAVDTDPNPATYNTLLRDTQTGNAKVQVSSAGSTYVFRMITTSSSCQVTYRINRVIPMTLIESHPTEQMIIGRATFSNHYSTCQPNPSFTASFEGVARSRGYGTSTTFDPSSFRLENRVSLSPQIRSSPSFALPSVIVRNQNEANPIFFGINGIPATETSVRLGTSAEFSSVWNNDDSIPVNLASVVLSGSPTSRNLAIATNSLPLGYHTIGLMALDTITNSYVPYDVLLKVVSPTPTNSPPTISISANAIVDCPSTVTVTSTDTNGDTMNLFWRPTFPYPATLANSTTSNTMTTVFSFTPTNQNLWYVFFTATDGKTNGFGYGLLTLSPILRNCPNSCSGKGVCNCDNTCTCQTRYLPPNCGTYDNNAPSITTTIITLNEDTVSTGKLSFSDSHNDQVTFSLDQSSVPPSISVVVNSNGDFVITPQDNYFNFNNNAVVRLDQIRVTVTETNTDNRLSSTSLITIRVVNVQDPPRVTANFTATVNEDCALFSGSVAATDLDNDPLTFTFGQQSFGKLNVVSSSAGTFNYVCGLNTFGLESISFSVTDGKDTATGRIAITINPVNDRPISQSSSVSTNEDTPVQVTMTGSDVDSSIIFVIVQSPTQGKLSAVSGNTVTYTPNLNYFGQDTFQFVTRETSGSPALDSTVSTITINVASVNDLPVIGMNTFSMMEDTSISFTLSASDVDTPTNNLRFTNTSQTNPPSVLTFNTLTGSFTVTPPMNYFGTLTFQFTVSDQIGTPVSGTATINVNNVNDPPTFTVNNAQTTEDSGAQTFQAISNLNLGPNEVNSVLQVNFQLVDSTQSSLFSQQPSMSSSGLLSYSFNPNVAATVNVSVSFRDNGGVSNGGLDTSVTRFFTISSTQVNDPPTFTLQNVVINEDSSLNNFFALNINPGPLESSQTVSFSTSTTCSSLITGPISLTSDGRIQGTLIPNAFGSCLISFNCRDNGGTSSGGSDTTLGSFTLTVNPVNDPPSFNTLTTSFIVNEDQGSGSLLSFPFANSISTGATNENDGLSFTMSPPYSGNLFTTLPSISTTTGELTFALAANRFGSATFTVQLVETNTTGKLSASSTPTITITVNAINDPPTFDLQVSSLSYLEDETPLAKSIIIAKNISPGPFEDTQSVSFVLNNGCPSTLFTNAPSISISGSQATLNFELAPNRFQSSQCTLSLVLNDGQASNSDSVSKQVSLIVTPVNDAPSFDPLTLNIALTENLSAKIGYSQQWALNINPGPFEVDNLMSFNLVAGTNSNSNLFSVSPTLSSSGLLSFTINQQASGFAEFSITLIDSQGTDNGGSDRTQPVTLRINIQAAAFALDFTISQSIVTVDEDSGVSNLNNFITAIDTPDPSFVSELTISALITSQTAFGNNLFSSQPSLSINSQSFTNGKSGTANLSFRPGDDLFGSANLTVTVRVPSRGASVTKSFRIVVNPINDLPSFNSISSISVSEDSGQYSSSTFATNVLAGPGGEGTLDSQTVSFTVTGCTNPSLFSVLPSITISSSSGRLTFTPATNQNGQSQCDVNLIDSLNAKSTRSLTITVSEVNDPPTFTIPSTLSVNEDATPVTVTSFAKGISAGPTNENSQVLTFTLTPSNPSLFSSQPSISPSTGDLVFTVSPNVFGSTVVNVVLDDGMAQSNSISSSFLLTIEPVNDQPTFVLTSTSISNNEDSGSVAFPNFVTSTSKGPTNEASQSLSWIITTNNEALFFRDPQSNTIFRIDEDGKLSFTVLNDVSGKANITITLVDNGGTSNGGVDRSSQTVEYTLVFINDQPSFITGNPIVISEDSSLINFNWATSISKGDSLEDISQTISFSVLFNNSLLTTCSINEEGKITIVPAKDAFGDTIISISLTDNLGSSFVANSSVTVTPVNDPPSFVFSKNVFNVTEDDGKVTFNAAATSIFIGPPNELSTDTPTFTLSIVSSPQGNLLSGVPTINPVSGDLAFETVPNAFGSATVSVTLSDGKDSTSPITFTINVLPKNDPPTFTVPSNTLSVNEDEGPFNLQVFTNLSPGPTNEASQTLSFSVSGIDPSNIFSQQPTVSSTGRLTFNTNTNYYGTFNFSVTLVDNGGKSNGGSDQSALVTVSVIIQPVNDLPIANPDSYTTNEDVAVSCPVTNNDTDVDIGDVVTVSRVSVEPSNGKVLISSDRRSITYTPNLNFFGRDFFTYIATDGASVSSLSNPVNVTITINPINDPPVSQPSSFSVNEDSVYSVPTSSILLVTDVDSTSFSYSVNSTVTSGKLVLNPTTVTYTPNPNFCGKDSFTYFARDSSQASTSLTQVSITVNCLPDSPTASNISRTMEENTNVRNQNIAIDVIASDPDADEFNLRYQCTSGPVRGSIQIALNTYYPISNKIFYTPTPWRNGIETLNCFVEDSTGLRANFNIRINVTGPANHQPEILDPYIRINTFEDISGSAVVRGLDWDDTPITYLIRNNPPSFCSVSFNSSNNGMFTFVPSPNQNGLCNFTWYVSDGQLSSPNGVVEIFFAPVNDAPVAQNLVMEALEEVPTRRNVSVSDIDLITNIDQLFYKLVNAPSFGTMTWTSDTTSPEFTYTGNKDFFGVDTFTYRVFDLANTPSEIRTVTVNVINVNDAPVALSKEDFVTDEEVPISINLGSLVSDIDNTLNQLSFSIKNLFGPQKGTLGTLGPVVTYTPSLNQNGKDTFIYVVSDGQFQAEGRITITINPINDAPVCFDDTWTLASNSFYSDNIRSTDADGDSLVYTIVTQPTRGSLDISNIPFVQYVATISDDPNYEAKDFFEFRSNDGKVNSNVARVSIDIIKTNNTRPESSPSTFSVLEDFSLTQVLVAKDNENFPLTYFIMSQPSNGKVNLVTQRPGEFVYTPNPNFNGQDSFSFRVRDQFYFSPTSVVTINVIPVNDPPVINPITRSTNEDTPINITLTSFDIDGDAVTYTILTPGKIGEWRISGNTLTYSPGLNRNGIEVLTYQSNDGKANSNQETITINIIPVNDPPMAINASFSFNEDTTLTGIVRANDPDSSLTYYVSNQYREYRGTLSINLDGSFVFNPDPNFNGVEFFLFIADDGALTSIGRVDMVINPVNDRPMALSQSVSVNEDSQVTIQARGTDVDGDPLSFILQTGISVSGARLTFTPPSTFVYTPPPNFFGKDSFTFTANDGIVNSLNSATVSIDILPVNDPPMVSDNIYGLQAGQSILITVVASDIDNLQNELNLALLDTVTALGTAERVISPPLSFIYRALPSSTPGKDTIRVQVSDGLNSTEGRIEIFVTTTPPRPPRVSNVLYTGREDTTFVGKLIRSVRTKTADIDRYIITEVQLSGSNLTDSNGTLINTNPNSNSIFSNDGVFNVQPATDFFGIVSFEFKAIDLNGAVSDTAKVSIDFRPVNDRPVAVSNTYFLDEDNTLTIQLTGTDIDSLPTSLTYSLVSTNLIQGHTFSLDQQTGTFTLTPKQDFFGQLSFTFSVSDGQLRSTSPGSIQINVLPINDPPQGKNLAFQTVEDTVLNGAVTATDIDSNSLTFSSEGLVPQLGDLVFNSDGSFQYTPDLNQNEQVSFKYTVSDGSLTDQKTVTISITPVNDPPTAVPLSFITNEDTEICRQLSGSDIEDPIVQFSPSDNHKPLNAKSFVLLLDGRFCYTPKENFNGDDSFSYFVYDSEGLTSTEQVVTIQVLEIYDPPNASPISLTVDEDSSVNGTLLGSSIESLPLTYTITKQPSLGTISVDGDRITYTPFEDENGVDLAYYSVSDGKIEVLASITIQINPVNDPPTVINITTSAKHLVPTVEFLQGKDIDGDSLSFEIVSQPQFGTVAIQGNAFTYIYNSEAFSNSDSFTYRAFDSKDYSGLGYVTISPLTRETVDRGNAGDQNTQGSNITGAAVGGSIAALVVASVSFFAYRKFSEYKESQSLLKEIKNQSEFQENPLYLTLSTDISNPLYEAPEATSNIKRLSIGRI